MDQSLQAIDPTWIESIATTVDRYGYVGFAVLSLAATAAFYKDPVLRIAFGLVFVVAALFSGFLFLFNKEPLQILAGTFGEVPRDAEPSATSPNPHFYAAQRHSPNTVQLDWVYIVPSPGQIAGATGLKFSYQERVAKTEVSNDGKLLSQMIPVYNSFELPEANFRPTDRRAVPFFKWERSFDPDSGIKVICFSGDGLKVPLCGKPFGAVHIGMGALGNPPLERHGSLGPTGWLLRLMFPAAAAQPGGSVPPLSGAALEEALLSPESRRWSEAAKVIEGSPSANATLVNRILARPIDTNTYSARLAIVTALRDHYRSKNLVYPDSTALSWMADSSWRRVILDSFDRSDPLGDVSRRLLRVSKSTQAKAALDNTLAQIKPLGGATLARCLDLLTQDIYVNWAFLSLENLKVADLSPFDTANKLGALLEPIGLPPGAGINEGFRLRADYTRAVVMLEAAATFSNADSPQRKELEERGKVTILKVKEAIDRLGLTALRAVYPVQPAELDKAVDFVASLNKNGKIDLGVLREARSGVLAPYPSCKL
jgi:hypothetical protein